MNRAPQPFLRAGRDVANDETSSDGARSVRFGKKTFSCDHKGNAYLSGGTTRTQQSRYGM